MFFRLSELIWSKLIWSEFVLCAPDDRLVEDEAISVAQSNAEGGHLSLPLQWTAWQQKRYWVSTDRKTGRGGRQASRMMLTQAFVSMWRVFEGLVNCLLAVNKTRSLTVDLIEADPSFAVCLLASDWFVMNSCIFIWNSWKNLLFCDNFSLTAGL